MVTTRGRAHEAFETVTECVERNVGVRTHLGKLKAWLSGGGHAPIGLSILLRFTTTPPDPQVNAAVLLGPDSPVLVLCSFCKVVIFVGCFCLHPFDDNNSDLPS